ncbi:cryptochrome/photolyase family protein [Cyanobium sp. CH-040]|uniref:cryptochrome/photolyase family protein n=1 Tax=Cyanobium sp. CH-040 TaxID=2823708 RepID=UPI0020CE785C|nr:cryptochrome/photolyase family protein [Cyanobium sp. CH-040]MCP9927000.1 cryptochrome/photolyase family protein [Cyanobium sp. CH-040]
MKGIWVLGDQLSAAQAALAAAEPASPRVLLLESTSSARARRCHRQKLVLVWSAMRHFAAELAVAGWTVDHRQVENFRAGLAAWIAEHGITELHLMEPAERPFRASIVAAVEAMGAGAPRLVWHASNAFLWSRNDFAAWAHPYKQLRMELFYREGRRRFGVLMDGEGQPLGGQWNFDQANRKAPPRGLKGPEPLWFEPDAITADVIAKVERLADDLEAGGGPRLPGDARSFRWAVTREQALAVLKHFIATRLDGFGPYQDAMVSGEPTLWHALLSPYLNLGLLQPLEVIRRLEQAGRERRSPLAGLEGVIRQILGWREYTHGLYWWFGADYTASNHFGANGPLPDWLERLGGSGMACMDTVLGELESSGYAHHIQRLMVLANYGLIAGLDPQSFTAWFQRMFIDGYDWVMQTNVLGMGLFADGGRLASKPYAASGSYINRMSTYCKGCRYDVKQRSGPDACPFNALYWDFLARHQESLRRNPRMALVMKQLEKLPDEELAAIRTTAAGLRKL